MSSLGSSVAKTVLIISIPHHCIKLIGWGTSTPFLRLQSRNYPFLGIFHPFKWHNLVTISYSSYSETNLPSNPMKNSSCCLLYTGSAEATNSFRARWNATISSKPSFNKLKANKNLNYKQIPLLLNLHVGNLWRFQGSSWLFGNSGFKFSRIENNPYMKYSFHRKMQV